MQYVTRDGETAEATVIKEDQITPDHHLVDHLQLDEYTYYWVYRCKDRYFMVKEVYEKLQELFEEWGV